MTVRDLVDSSFSQKQLLEIIRNAAAKGHYVITLHATERMNERDISRIMIEKCLLTGHIQPNRLVKFNDEFNTYECRLSNYFAGIHYDVVTAVDPKNPNIIVVTVIDTQE